MALIKSAVEIALERTEAVKVDKEALEADRARKEGKMLASKFLGEPGVLPQGRRWQARTPAITRWLREGRHRGAARRTWCCRRTRSRPRGCKRIAEGFASIGKNDKRLQQIFSQLEGFFKEYVEERERLREMVNKQYEPVRKQKEAELAQRMGQQVRIDPQADPDYVNALRRALGTIEDRYGGVLTKVKGEVTAHSSRKRVARAARLDRPSLPPKHLPERRRSRFPGLRPGSRGS